MALNVRLIPRFMNSNGVAATVSTYVKSGTDTYGDPTWTITDHSIDKAVLSYARRNLLLDSTVLGRQFIIEAEVYIKDVDFDLLPLTVPLQSDERRPEITIGGIRYDAFEAEKPGHGLTRFICQKMRVD